ncbi:MAG: hypothetical protein DRN95_07430, partial [Candidatus Hydrothermarchaeota archaeon]
MLFEHFLENKRIIFSISILFLISIPSGFVVYRFVRFDGSSIYWVCSTLVQALITLLAICVPLVIYLMDKANRNLLDLLRIWYLSRKEKSVPPEDKAKLIQILEDSVALSKNIY